MRISCSEDSEGCIGIVVLIKLILVGYSRRLIWGLHIDDKTSKRVRYVIEKARFFRFHFQRMAFLLAVVTPTSHARLLKAGLFLASHRRFQPDGWWSMVSYVPITEKRRIMKKNIWSLEILTGQFPCTKALGGCQNLIFCALENKLFCKRLILIIRHWQDTTCNSVFCGLQNLRPLHGP